MTAADEALAVARQQNRIPNTIHLYQRAPSAVSMGCSQSINDINADYCQHHNIPLIRRSSGGGSIYTDRGCLIYSLVFNPLDQGLSTPQIVFDRVCGWLVNALKSLHITTTHKPPNDILLNAKKISGSAQRRKPPITLIHGTLLVNTDLSVMEKVLPHSVTPVTTLYKEIPTDSPSFDQLKNALISTSEHSFNMHVCPGAFTPYEQQLINKLLDTRYHCNEWTTKR